MNDFQRLKTAVTEDWVRERTARAAEQLSRTPEGATRLERAALNNAMASMTVPLARAGKDQYFPGLHAASVAGDEEAFNKLYEPIQRGSDKRMAFGQGIRAGDRGEGLRAGPLGAGETAVPTYDEMALKAKNDAFAHTVAESNAARAQANAARGAAETATHAHPPAAPRGGFNRRHLTAGALLAGAGVGAGALYSHYGNKSAAYVAGIADILRRFR